MATMGKLTEKITGKAQRGQNRHYETLNDSASQSGINAAKSAQHEGITLARTAENFKLQLNAGEAVDAGANPGKSVEVIDEKRSDSRWRSAIDEKTGLTYYYHKDTKETVWDKPKNF